MAECEQCGSVLEQRGYECSNCGRTLCVDHRRVEEHDCSGDETDYVLRTVADEVRSDGSGNGDSSTDRATVLDERSTVRYGLITLVVVALFYSILVRRLLAGVFVITWVVGIYLVWRFVRAHERIADALETGDDRGPSDGIDEKTAPDR